jgi:hypothetical protein
MGLSRNRRQIAKKRRRNGVRSKIIATPRGWRRHRNQTEAGERLKTRGLRASPDDSPSERNILTTHLGEHYTDTHGYTEINFAAFAMLGSRFCPASAARGSNASTGSTPLGNMGRWPRW